MKKVFISVPMHGRSDDDVRKDFQKVMDELGSGYELADTLVEEESPPCKNPRLWYLGRSIQLMCDADIIVFIGEWMEAHGCCVEHAAALEYGLPILYM